MAERHITEDVAELAQFLHDKTGPHIETVAQDGASAVVAFSRDDLNFLDLTEIIDKYRENPRFLAGIAVFTTADSFVAHVARFQEQSTAIFVCDEDGSFNVTAVYDYHDGVRRPRRAAHRARFVPERSREWIAWSVIGKSGVSQQTIAEFLEDNMQYLLEPPTEAGSEDDRALFGLARRLGGTYAPPVRLMEVARAVSIHASSRVRNAINTNTGEIDIAWEVEHNAAMPATASIPNLFLVALRVFDRGSAYPIPVRLRYRLRDGEIKWFISLYRPDQTFSCAVDNMVAAIQAKTGIEPFYGSPES